MISKETFAFLRQLDLNNDREWFRDHKSEYEFARKNVIDFASLLIKGISSFDAAVPADLDPKDCTMRIYRDIRFRTDKTPYKTNFSIAISPNGKNFKGPGYYVEIKPDASFAGGGTWFPPSDELKSIRQEIDYNASELYKITDGKKFKALFQDLDREHVLRTAPKGYEKDHPEIAFLKLKSFTVTRALKDAELSSEDAPAKIIELFYTMYPLIVFLRNAIS